ncbi:MAG: MOSC domain-containing protein [Bacteroidetes bacterium]|nr:MAG: MOSC domain-containing protein [Bacteroidota bacterium]
MASPYHLTGLFVYPIKSLGGISLPRWRVGDRGLHLDRRWMLVDEAGRFLSQRELPGMARLSLSLRGDELLVQHRHEDREPLLIPSEPETDIWLTAQIWDDQVLVQAVSPLADAWFTETLGRPCRLVYQPDTSHRPVDPRYARGQEGVSLADGYPTLIIGEASLQDLNDRLAQPVPMDRFRPNLVFSGGEAHDEDTWTSLQLGPITFYPVKPCARCQVVTTDQATGARSPEPLRTLSTYRRQAHKVLFGMNLLHEGDGDIAVGMPLVTS